MEYVAVSVSRLVVRSGIRLSPALGDWSGEIRTGQMESPRPATLPHGEPQWLFYL